jgi:multisubunit Na+/H+ antiporter MnhB subunit
LFLDMFMSWYSVDVGGALGAQAARTAGIDTSVSAWQAFSTTDVILFALVVATLASLFVGNRAPGGVVAAIGAFATLIVFWRILNQPGPNKIINVDWGAYVGLLLCALLTYGGIRELGADESPAGQPVAA